MTLSNQSEKKKRKLKQPKRRQKKQQRSLFLKRKQAPRKKHPLRMNNQVKASNITSLFSFLLNNIDLQDPLFVANSIEQKQLKSTIIEPNIRLLSKDFKQLETSIHLIQFLSLAALIDVIREQNQPIQTIRLNEKTATILWKIIFLHHLL